MGQNSRENFAALAAEEERQRANELAATERRPTAEDVESARGGRDLRPGLTGRILTAIRHAFVR